MSDFHKDAPEWLKQVRSKYHDERFQQLNGLLISNSAAVWTYLLAVNGGAAAGTLAFIGAKADIANQVWPYWLLGVFLLGVILVGLAHAFLVHKAQSLVDNWISLTDRYWRNEIEWKDVQRDDDKAVDKHDWLPWVLGWASLLLFICGVAWAAYEFKVMAELAQALPVSQ